MKYAASALILLSLVALTGCGYADMPGAIAAQTASAPELLPLFDADGQVVRDTETDRPVVAIRDGTYLADVLLPAFDAEGMVKRCPETGAPLCVIGGDVRLVRTIE